MNVLMTGDGYEYVRDRTGGEDNTLYLHQLDAIAAGADPAEVFDPDSHVHHRQSIPWANWPDNVEVVDAAAHGAAHRFEQLARAGVSD